MSCSFFSSSPKSMYSHNLENRSPSPTDNYFSNDWTPSPIFPDSPSKNQAQDSPISPLDLNDGLDDIKTPMSNASDYSSYFPDSPLISGQPEVSSQIIPVEQPTSSSTNSPTTQSSDSSLSLLDCQDLLDFSKILSKMEERAELIQNSSSFKSEVNKRIMLAALYQRMAKTFRKLGLNEYAIVVPPAVRDASRFLNQGFRPVGTTAWQVGDFHYDTSSSLWSPCHPRFSR